MNSRSSIGRSRGRSTGRGWYGDEREHSEAAREGWEHRRGGRSRSEEDDEDSDYQRSSSNRGGNSRRSEGRGWYGDEEGHSDASREGWEHRGGRRTRGHDKE